MRAASLLATLLVCASPAVAADLVVFDDGRVIRAEELVVADGVATLDLEGGARIQVPDSRIARIEPAPDLPPPVEAATEPTAEQMSSLADSLRPAERWRDIAGRYADDIAAAADRHGLDRALLAAVAKTESNFDPFAVSPKGACGLLQLMPATAQRFGVTDVFDPDQNLEGGARYLRWLIDHFDGRLDLALAGYNAGERAVERHRGIPPYRETMRYVAKVLDGTIAGQGSTATKSAP